MPDESQLLREEVAKLSARLDHANKAVLDEFNGRWILASPLSRLVRDEVASCNGSTGQKIDDQIKVLLSEHREKLRIERQVRWGLSLATIAAAMVALYTIVSNTNRDLQLAVQNQATQANGHLEQARGHLELMQVASKNAEKNSSDARDKVVVVDQALRELNTLTDKLLIVYAELDKISGGKTAALERLRIPIGTRVMLSAHEVEDFLDEHMADELWLAEPGEGFKPNKARWTLADGRKLSGSKYHELFGQSAPKIPAPDKDTVVLIKINP